MRGATSTGIGAKGKAVVLIDGALPPPPPVGSLSGNAGELDTEDVEAWRRFREVGLLDEAAMERRDREALLERASRLENLKRLLHDLQEEHVLIKKVSDSKLADAKALAAGNEEKSLEVEEKMRVAESKLA
ncbi:hypothetical protein NC653_020482 [Populus alba x Populus x berolinensis]|uniref:Uncharacterized protein n=1 Tax=Populus alba x Populus x berolinensis TaxID=444605 RepID=A0AAD6MKI6_9ROSI|nr:hypothetical protein NC653_020482 [Populus alba x Populus x berolinensis]